MSARPSHPDIHPVHCAIAKNDDQMLRQALAAHPKWQGETQAGTSCWAQVIINKDRNHLWGLLTEHGLTHDAWVIYKGKSRQVLSLAVEFGRLKLIRELLDAGANPNVGVKRPGSSAIEVLTRRWTKVTSEAETYTFLDVIERFNALGATVSPHLLSVWMTYAGYRTGKHANQAARLRVLSQSAWDKGVRPMCEQAQAINSPLAPLQAGLLLMLHVGDEGARAWLSELLLTNQPTPLWGRIAMDEIGRNHHARNNFPALLEVIKAAWPAQPMLWDQGAVGGWKSRFELRVSATHSVMKCANHHLALLHWAMDNGLPVEHLVQTKRALVPSLLSTRVLAAFASPDFPLQVLAFAFSHQQWLSTSMAGAHSLEQYLVSLMPNATNTGLISGDRLFAKEFWQRHGLQCRTLEASMRSALLMESWNGVAMLNQPAGVRF